MARSMWRGAVSFGMVAIPIKLYKATDGGKGVSFRQLCPEHDHPIKLPRVCPDSMQPVQGDVRKGFEVGKDEYIVVDEQDLAALDVPTLHTITLDQFVKPPAGSAIALWTQGSYYLEPEAIGATAFGLLKAALEKTGRWGVGKVAMRDREHLCVVAPYGRGLLLATIAWPQDVRDQGELRLPEPASDPKMLEVAVQLVENLAAPFNPADFHDTYRAAVEQLVAAKREGRRPTVAHAAPSKGVDDLMDQLRASIAASKAA